MRTFEWLRTSFGLPPIRLQNDTKETCDGTVAVTAVRPPAADAMCCGHCSGNAEGHISELPRAL